jgi:ArsR family transcriptional regulator
LLEEMKKQSLYTSLSAKTTLESEFVKPDR